MGSITIAPTTDELAEALRRHVDGIAEMRPLFAKYLGSRVSEYEAVLAKDRALLARHDHFKRAPGWDSRDNSTLKDQP